MPLIGRTRFPTLVSPRGMGGAWKGAASSRKMLGPSTMTDTSPAMAAMKASAAPPLPGVPGATPPVPQPGPPGGTSGVPPPGMPSPPFTPQPGADFPGFQPPPPGAPSYYQPSPPPVGANAPPGQVPGQPTYTNQPAPEIGQFQQWWGQQSPFAQSQMYQGGQFSQQAALVYGTPMSGNLLDWLTNFTNYSGSTRGTPDWSLLIPR